MVDGFRIRDRWTTFVFTPALDHKATWNGISSLPDVLGVVRSGMDHEVLMPAGWSTIEIDVADSLIASEGLLPERALAGTMTAEKGQLRLSASAAAAARRELLQLFGRHERPTRAALTDDAAHELRRQALDLLAVATECSGHEPTERYAPSVHQAHQLVQKARALLDAQVQVNPTIESVARELGVTTRTLQRCFFSSLGVSPKQYFLARKLDAARRALRRQRSCVVDVAHDFGFASPSRFTEQFNRQFGQTPSTVIRHTPHPPSPYL